MNNNTFLLRVGLSPDNFKRVLIEPIKTGDGFIYDLEERTDIRVCPFCDSTNVVIKSYYHQIINVSNNTNLNEQIRIKRVHFSCKSCKHTFSNSLKGIERGTVITDFIKHQIIHDFRNKLTFQDIANKYHISSAMVIKLFDENVGKTPLGSLPEILCIDEIHFSSTSESKYICILVDFNKKTVFDIIESRQSAYLNRYFERFNKNDRDKVKYFISDMYDAYATVKRKFFPSAMHIIDLFHIIIQLNRTTNILRTRTMNNKTIKGSKEYNFMKTHWKCFICRSNNVPDKFYTYKATGEMIHYDAMIIMCLKLNERLYTAYNVLQDLYKYSRKNTYTEASKFIDWIASRLINSLDDDLAKVGYTYKKWQTGIANAFAKNQTDLNLTNGIIEGMNNQIRTIIKSAYGYKNFERFRKRILLIYKYNKNWL